MHIFISVQKRSKRKDNSTNKTIADAIVERERISGRRAKSEVNSLSHNPRGASAKWIVAIAIEDDTDAVLPVALDIDGSIEKHVDCRSPGGAAAEMGISQSCSVTV